MENKVFHDRFLLKNEKIKHFFRIMKITTLLLFVGILSIYAEDSYSQKARVTINEKNIRLDKVLTEIEKQTDYLFIYNDKVETDQRVSVKANTKPVYQVLNDLFKETNVSYSMEGSHIILSNRNEQEASSVNTPLQEGKTITGKVLDANGEPLVGVSVAVKGTTTGTITDIDGSFSIRVPNPNSALVFSFIGFLSQEVDLKGQATVNVTLSEDIKILDEIVVVGYGVQRKSDVVGSISVATADQLLQAPSYNALQGLKGKASGVTIFNTTGNPMGSDDNNGGQQRVIIRGVNSINTSTNPLYVVDGVQMSDIQFLNPNDIERMEVLKDASATAIYGARGANGVILVTTKRGATGAKGSKVSYAGWMSVSTLSKEVELLNSDEFMQVQRIGMSNISYYKPDRPNLTPDTSSKLLFDANGNPLYDTNWQKEATRDAFSHNHQLSIQTQGDRSSTGVFLNFTDQQGLLLNNYSKRLNAKFTYDTKVQDWLSIDANILVNHVWGNTINDSSGGQTARRTIWEMPPIYPVKWPDGSWSSTTQGGTNFGLEGMSNPVHELETSKRRRYKTKVFGNFAAVFHILPGLDLRTQIGVDANFRTSKNYFPNDLENISKPLGEASINHFNSLYWQEETYLTYSRAFNENHRLNATLGLSWSQNEDERDGTGNVKGFSDNFFGFDNLEAGTTPSAPTSSWSRWSMNSYFARASYTFKDRYMATATLRVDGSSRFGKNNKYAWFPSMGLGWMLSEESFMKDQTWLSNLKLHTSYGATGNTEIDPYLTKPALVSGTALLNGGRVPSIYPGGMPNPDLKWERTDQFDIGIDFGLLNNRINVEASYYYKKTNNLLLARPLPYTTGYTSVMDNIGRVDNQGIDFMLNTVNINTKDFRWETTFNMNYNKNEIKKLGANNEDILTDPNFLDGQVILRVGESLGSFWGYERLGTWSTDEAAEAAKVNAKPGEAKRSKDKKILGKGLPDLTGSFINRFYYKNFDLTVDLQFVSGVDVRQDFFHSAEDRTGIANTLKSSLYDAWRPDRQNTMVQQIRQANYADQNSVSDSHWVADGSYIRGNLIQLGYTFGPSVLKKLKVSSLRVNASVNNAFLICSSDFKGYDPEASSNTNRFGQNVFFYQYPTARTFSFGLNVSF